MRFYSLLLLTLTLLITGCAPPLKVSHSIDQHYPYADLLTWDWLPRDEAPDCPLLIRQQVSRSVLSLLQERGYVHSDEAPDFYVACQTLLSDSGTAADGSLYQFSLARGEGGVRISAYPEGMLILGFLDGRTRAPFWSGTVTGTALRSREQTQSLLHEALSQLLEAFPP